MTQEEIKTKEALATLGYNADREVTGKELYYSFLGLSNRYNPEVNPTSGDTLMLRRVNDAYEYLSKNICRVNETIRNIIDPLHKTYIYQEEKPVEAEPINKTNPIDDNQSMNQNLNPQYRGNLVIVDKPSVFGIILSILIPIYGIINFFIVRKVQPRASKWYLLIGIIGMILNMVIMMGL